MSITNLEQMTLKYKMEDLTGDEIQRLTGKPPILFSELSNFSNIDQVLGKENHAVILYQTSSRTQGHYVAITRNDLTGKIRYCDPYGIPSPLKEVQYTQYDQALPNYLQNLLANTNYEANTTDFQSWRAGVSTCGRYASLFCKLRNLSLLQIDYLLKRNSGFLANPDNVATILTLMALDDIAKFYSN